jgi:hypothetical protein
VVAFQEGPCSVEYVHTYVHIIHMCVCNVSALNFWKETRAFLDTLKVVAVLKVASIYRNGPQP